MKTILYIIVGLGLLVISVCQLESIQRQRTAEKLDLSNPFVESNLDYDMSLPLPALFIFRSLAIDYLWLRATEMQQEGQYFDALHLARLICKLQPNLDSVWEFQAWNMAYNISVECPAAEQRWQWVKNGYELIRDQGLAANPRSAKLYNQMSIIFQHKMGQVSDDYHRYYKKRMVEEFGPLVGMSGVNEIKQLSQAPKTWDVLIGDSSVKIFLDKLIALEPSFKNYEDINKRLRQDKISAGDFTGELKDFLISSYGDEGFQKLSIFRRACSIRDLWKMDLDFMHQIDKKYGQVEFGVAGQKRKGLDWRHVNTHGLYWALKGKSVCDRMTLFEKRTFQRATYHNLQSLFFYGKIKVFRTRMPDYKDRDEGIEIAERAEKYGIIIFCHQDIRMFPVAFKAALGEIKIVTEQHKTGVGQAKVSIGGFEAGARNLGMRGIVSLYLAGNKVEAAKYLKQIHEAWPAQKKFADVTVAEFVKNILREDIESGLSSKDARMQIDSFLRNSLSKYAIEDDDESVRIQAQATEAYKIFIEENEGDDVERQTLPTFAKLVSLSLLNFFDDPTISSPYKSLLLERIQLEQPDKYNLLIKQLQKQEDNAKKNSTEK